MKVNKTYVLFIRNDNKLPLRVGRALFCVFPPGEYIYIGSAKKNLKKRVLRHFSSDKKYHWHIDYFLAYTKIEKVYIGKIEEKELVSYIFKTLNPEIPCPGFGASDSPCLTHLFLIKDEDLVIDFLKSLDFSYMEI